MYAQISKVPIFSLFYDFFLKINMLLQSTLKDLSFDILEATIVKHNIFTNSKSPKVISGTFFQKTL